MIRRFLGVLVLAALPTALSVRATPQLCRVQVISTPGALAWQRELTIRTVPDCPRGGVAYVRLASRLGGSLPDDPPGVYVVRPGGVIRHVSFAWWWVEWISASGRPYRVPEGSP